MSEPIEGTVIHEGELFRDLPSCIFCFHGVHRGCLGRIMDDAKAMEIRCVCDDKNCRKPDVPLRTHEQIAREQHIKEHRQEVEVRRWKRAACTSCWFDNCEYCEITVYDEFTATTIPCPCPDPSHRKATP